VNVLFFSQFFSTTRGGGEYVISLIAKKLAENNHKVLVITNRIAGETYNVHQNIELIFVPPVLEYKGGLPPSFSDNIRYILNAFRVGLKIIKKSKIDIIHSNNFSPALVGSLLSSITSKPHVTSIWDIFTLCGKDYWNKWTQQIGVSKINRIIGPRFEKLVLKGTLKAIHTISEATKNDLLKFGAKKPIYVIFPSIEDVECQNVKQNPLQFVYVGRLVFYKNVEVLIKAINIVKKTEPDVKLIIVGGGPHEKILRNLISDLKLQSNIEFKGYVDAEEKIKLIVSSNALLFPSLCEGFGLVILEAFSQNRPVFVSNVKPLSDIISNQETGYVLDPHNEKIWAEHIIKIIKNPKEAERMGKNGMELLKTKYNQDNMYEKIIKMYQEIF